MPVVLSLMLTAARLGCSSVAQQLLLIDPAVALNAGGNSTADVPLHVAALKGHAAVFSHLLAAAPALDVFTANHDVGRGWTLMHSCVEGGCMEIMQTLLQAAPGAASWVTENGMKPLHTACKSENVQAAQLLLDIAPGLAAAPDEYGYLPLHLAASTRNTAVLRLLLAAGAPGLDAPAAEDGNTPLHFAASLAPAAVPLLLTAYPAAALLRNGKGQLPLHCALDEASFGAPGSLGAARLLLPVSGLSGDQLLDALAEAGPARPAGPL